MVLQGVEEVWDSEAYQDNIMSRSSSCDYDATTRKNVVE